MSDKVLVSCGSYRSDRMGVRLADYVVAGLRERGTDAEMVDAKVVDLPMLDRMYKEYPKGAAPAPMEGRQQGGRGVAALRPKAGVRFGCTLEAHPPLSLSAEFHRSYPPMQVCKDQVVTEENPGKTFIDIAAAP